MKDEQLQGSPTVARIGLLAGPALALLLSLSPLFGWHLDPQQPRLNAMAAIALLMAVWWLTEAIPMAATALIPLFLFPLLKIIPGTEVSAAYGHPLVFLFLGGFLIALAIEESGLHRRIALVIVAAMGDNPRKVIWGFMLATALLSMWISNTATTLMMLPIAMSILASADRNPSSPQAKKNFGIALMLGIAYSASIGGMATLIGTPPNLAFKGIYEQSFPLELFPQRPEIGFFNWMIVALPFSLLFLGITWSVLCLWIFPTGKKSFLGGRSVIREELQQLGPMTAVEWQMATIFGCTAWLWVFREPFAGFGWAPLLGLSSWVNDGTSAIFMATICFAIPSITTRGKRLLHWEATKRLPWGLLILFGGGLALAKGMSAAGLDSYLGEKLAAAIGSLPGIGKMAALAFGMTWLTELTSNLASVNMIMPVLAKAAKDLQVPPLLLMLPTTLAASCAFMLPVATPPNAIVFGSGKITVKDMMKAGIWLNLIGTVLVVITVAILGRLAFGDAAI